MNVQKHSDLMAIMEVQHGKAPTIIASQESIPK
jgi:hypothetical protein